jgi:integrase
MPARDIRPSHIRQILTPIWDRGAKRQAAKVRSFLRAAFAYGATAEHSLGRTSGKAFGIEANPVDPVLVPDTSTPGERALSERELAHFWWTITETSTVGPVMSRLLQFVIATGGQRIEQVAREPWTSYDLEGRTLRLIDAKGRGGVRRVHLVPLTDRALEILARVREINGTSDWPWTTNGRQPISVTSPVHAIKVWLKSELGKLEDREISRFTPRDLRRTCAQLMQVNGVENRLADLLQSHGVSGVVAAHYRNNPEGYLPEKRRAVEQFEHALSKILVTGKASTKK